MASVLAIAWPTKPLTLSTDTNDVQLLNCISVIFGTICWQQIYQLSTLILLYAHPLDPNFCGSRYHGWRTVHITTLVVYKKQSTSKIIIMRQLSRRRHDMATVSALLVLCKGESTGHWWIPITRGQLWGTLFSQKAVVEALTNSRVYRWFETPCCSCDVIAIFSLHVATKCHVSPIWIFRPKTNN